MREAENGQEALKIWAEFEPYLIWMDIPLNMLNDFENALQILDLELINDQTKMIIKHNSALKADLEYLVSNFKFPELLSLIEETKSKIYT